MHGKVIAGTAKCPRAPAPLCARCLMLLFVAPCPCPPCCPPLFALLPLPLPLPPMLLFAASYLPTLRSQQTPSFKGTHPPNISTLRTCKSDPGYGKRPLCPAPAPCLLPAPAASKPCTTFLLPLPLPPCCPCPCPGCVLLPLQLAQPTTLIVTPCRYTSFLVLQTFPPQERRHCLQSYPLSTHSVGQGSSRIRACGLYRRMTQRAYSAHCHERDRCRLEVVSSLSC